MLGFLSIVLIGLLAVLLCRYAAWIELRPQRRPRRGAAFYALFSFPAYLVAAVLFAVTLPRLAAGPAALPRWRAARRVGALAGLALIAFSTRRLIQLHGLRAAAPAAPLLRGEQTHSDFAAMSWPDAFRALCGKLAAEYPFTEWKRIDWQRQCSELAPRVAEAARRGDRIGYYRALRELAWRIPDGHVGLEGFDGGLERQETGGSFGLALVELDPGLAEGRRRVVASRVEPGGPAARAGIPYGAEILAWNGAEVDAALARVPVLWTESPPATAETRRLAELRFRWLHGRAGDG